MGNSYPFEGYSRCILQLQLTGPQDPQWGTLTPLKDTVDVFYSSSWLDHRTLNGELLPLWRIQSMYSPAPADWTAGPSMGNSYPFEGYSRCILQLQLTGPQDPQWGTLTPLKDTVGVFYSSSWLDRRTLNGELLPLWRIQSMYSPAPADWTAGPSMGNSYPFERYSRCILQLQLTGPQDPQWGTLTPLKDTVDVFSSSSWLDRRTLNGELLPLWRIQSMYSTAPADWTAGPSMGNSYPFEGYSRCILQLQLTGPQDPQWGTLTPLKDTVDVFSSSSWLDRRTLNGELLPLWRIQSMYSPAPADWTAGPSMGNSYPFEGYSRCILQLQLTGPQDPQWGTLTPLKDTVDVFSSSSWLDRRTLNGELLPLWRIQSMYSPAPADWTAGPSMGNSYSFEGYSRCILQLQLTGPQNPQWGTLTPLKDTVDVFYSSSWLDRRTLNGELLPLWRIQSMYSPAPADWTAGPSMGNSYPFEGYSRCILQLQLTGPQDPQWGTLTPLKDTVDVFSSSSWLDRRTLNGELLPLWRIQSMYSTAPADWTAGPSMGNSYPFEGYSRCILQLQLTGPQDPKWGTLTPLKDTVDVFYSSSWLDRRTLNGELLPLWRIQSMYSTAPADWTAGPSMGNSYPFEGYSRCILQLQLTGPQDPQWGTLTPLKDTVDVFSSSSWLDRRTLNGELLPFWRIQSMYSIAPADWPAGPSMGNSYPFEGYSRCILQLQLTGPHIIECKK